MVQDSPSNLVTSAGSSVDLGQAVRPCGAAGSPGPQQEQRTELASSRYRKYPAAIPLRAPWHSRLMKAVFNTHIGQKIALVIWRSISRAPQWTHRPAVTWEHTSGCRRSVRGSRLGSVFINARNSKIFASGGISHPLDIGPFYSEMSLLPDRGRREMFPVSWAGWGLTAHWCLSWFP